MLIGAFNIAFGLSNTNALILNAALVVSYIAACLFLKTDYQIRLAELLTVLYALIMCAVYVGIFITMIDDGPLSLTSISFFVTHGSFVLAALLHPQELNCIWCLPIYILTIPSMYLLLTIYSIFNMNNVSWGTREAPKTEEEKAQENAEKAEAAKKKGKIAGIQDWARRFGSFSNFMSFSCCTAEDNSEKLEKQLAKIEEKLDTIIDDKTDKTGVTLRKSVGPQISTQQSRSFARRGKAGASSSSWQGLAHRGVDYPYWMEKNVENLDRCKVLVNAPLGAPLEDEEVKFWKDLIAKYLKPYSQIESKEEKERVSKELIELRNKMAFMFVMLNIIWVTLIYMLQSYAQILGIKWPFGYKGPFVSFDVTDVEEANVVILTHDYLRLDPLGLFFAVTFIILLVLQVGGMLWHRMLTVSHIVADNEEYPFTNLFNKIKNREFF